MSAQAIPTVQLELQKRVKDTDEEVRSLVIRSEQDYLAACALSKRIHEFLKTVDTTFDKGIELAYRAHKEAVATKKRFANPASAALQMVDSKILAYRRQQEEIRRRQEEELREQARKEREEAALREAEELHRQGETELAEAVLQQELASPAPVVALPNLVPRVEGLGTRVSWRWRVKNAALIPREYLEPNEIAINGVVRALKDKTQIPGIEVFSEDSAIHRG